MSEVRPVGAITLDLTPWEVFRALQALRESRGLIAEQVADKLQAAAPVHMEILEDIDVTVRQTRPPRSPAMTTDTLGQPSPDAEPVNIPGWRMRPMSDTPIHRESESCDRVGVVTPGPPCVELVLPAGLVAELGRGGMVPEAREVAAGSDGGSQAGNYATDILPARNGSIQGDVALGKRHSDIPDEEARAIRTALRRLERLEGKCGTTNGTCSRSS